ncbi:hypothetical protein GQ53DRAFT_831205 [Thozetella sp. PMI_491]|nr:hypothetical protein GQ53DRAFT_831205 [Thozetella sp. PMI_491]
MGRELQKRKRRSSRPTVRPRVKAKILNPMGNDIVAKNWDKTKTLAQNYSRLGLVAKLGTTAGGVEKRPGQKKKAPDPFRVKPGTAAVVGEAKIERDADGKIVRIVRPGTDNNPLKDSLNQFDSDEEGGEAKGDEEDAEEWGGIEDPDAVDGEVIRQLEEEANRPTEPAQRHQSSGEVEWLERLVAKHGDDTTAMARDIKLNPMQQTKADIARRLKKAGLR